jgi:hypothetical protein
MTLNVDPECGQKGDTIEYCYHFKDGDTDFKEGREWRQVKMDFERCVVAAARGELHEEIVMIEKVWHSERTEEAWVGYTCIWGTHSGLYGG